MGSTPGSGATARVSELAIRQITFPYMLFLFAFGLLVIGLWLLVWAEPTDEPESGNEDL